MRLPDASAAYAALRRLVLPVGLALTFTLQGCEAPSKRNVEAELEKVENMVEPPNCKPFNIQTPWGITRVGGSKQGGSPSIECPIDYVFFGPTLECRFLYTTCTTNPQGQRVCTDTFNLTRVGGGLMVWPGDTKPRETLVIRRDEESSNSTALRGTPSSAQEPGSGADAVQVASEGTTTSPLPPLSVITPGMLRCVPEPFIDLDFRNTEVTTVLKGDERNLRFAGIANVGQGDSVDLLLSQTMPNHTNRTEWEEWEDGKGSTMGVVTVENETELHFQFVKASTDEPVALNKFYFTLFDVADSIDALYDKEVIVSGISEYFISLSTQVNVAVMEDRPLQFKFFGSSAEGNATGRADVRKMWQSSLHSTVGLMFRSTSKFTLKVKALREMPAKFEFAGWSEIVRYGRKVFASTRESPMLAREREKLLEARDRARASVL